MEEKGMVKITTLKKVMALAVASLLVLLACTACTPIVEPIEYTDEVPPKLQTLYDRLNTVLDEWGYDEYTLAEIETPADIEKSQYIVKILTDKNESDPPSLSFFLNGDKLRTSYSLIYNNSNTAEEFRDLYAAVLKLADDSLDQAGAEAMAEELVASYDGKGIGEVLKVGGFRLFLHPADQSEHPWLEVKDEAELWIAMKNDPADYSTIDYEEFTSANLENQKRVKLTGTVERMEWEFSDIVRYYYNNLYVTDAAGNEYKAVYCYTGTPVDFEVGESYDFYGFTVNESTKENGENNIQLEYAEKDNERYIG